jgi:hypothetical protein
MAATTRRPRCRCDSRRARAARAASPAGSRHDRYADARGGVMVAKAELHAGFEAELRDCAARAGVAVRLHVRNVGGGRYGCRTQRAARWRRGQRHACRWVPSGAHVKAALEQWVSCAGQGCESRAPPGPAARRAGTRVAGREHARVVGVIGRRPEQARPCLSGDLGHAPSARCDGYDASRRPRRSVPPLQGSLRPAPAPGGGALMARCACRSMIFASPWRVGRAPPGRRIHTRSCSSPDG